MIGNETISIFSGYKKKLLGAFLSMLIILIVLVLIIVILVWILTKTDKIDSVLKSFISVSFIYFFFNVVSLMLFSFFFEEQCSAVQFLCIMSKVGFSHIERISLIMKFPVHEQTCHT